MPCAAPHADGREILVRHADRADCRDDLRRRQRARHAAYRAYNCSPPRLAMLKPCRASSRRRRRVACGARSAHSYRAARARGQRPLRGILSPSGANDASRRAAQSLGWTSGAQSAAASAPSAVSAASFVDAAPPLQGRTRARTISTAARRLQRRGAALTTARRGGGRCFVFRGRLVCECVPNPTAVDANTANPVPRSRPTAWGRPGAGAAIPLRPRYTATGSTAGVRTADVYAARKNANKAAEQKAAPDGFGKRSGGEPGPGADVARRSRRRCGRGRRPPGRPCTVAAGESRSVWGATVGARGCPE